MLSHGLPFHPALQGEGVARTGSGGWALIKAMILWQPGISSCAQVQSKQLRSKSPMGRCLVQYLRGREDAKRWPPGPLAIITVDAYPARLLTTRWQAEHVVFTPTDQVQSRVGSALIASKTSRLGAARHAARKARKPHAAVSIIGLPKCGAPNTVRRHPERAGARAGRAGAACKACSQSMSKCCSSYMHVDAV